MPELSDANSLGIQFEELPEDNNNWGLSSGDYLYCHRLINLAIGRFNQATKSDAKIDALKDMQYEIESLDLTISPDVLVKAEGFHNMKSALFSQIKAAYAENGVNTMLKPGRADSLLARIVSDMSPDKADRLMEILDQYQLPLDEETPTENARMVQSTSKDALQKLYKDDKTTEALAWEDFIRNHTIEFLGGVYSKNFKVTGKLDNQIQVLKVDNRIYMPRSIEQRLREQKELEDVFTPIHADRQVLGVDPKGSKQSRTLIVTDFCARGSVEDYSASVRARGDTNETYICTSKITCQMIQALTDIQKANCCFPDAKLTNWLVDADEKIHTADTKSFLFTTPDGEYWYNGKPDHDAIPGNEGTNLITTDGFEPTELSRGKFKAEDIHAFILGRNIYVCLTGLSPSSINLNGLVFQGPLGQEYKQLIQNLTVDEASERMRLEDAQAKLIELGMKAEEDAQVNRIELGMKANPKHKELFDKASEIGISDDEIRDFIKSKIKAGVKDQAVIAEELPMKLQSMKQEMEAVATAFKVFKGKFRDVQEQIKEGLDPKDDNNRRTFK